MSWGCKIQPSTKVNIHRPNNFIVLTMNNYKVHVPKEGHLTLIWGYEWEYKDMTVNAKCDYKM